MSKGTLHWDGDFAAYERGLPSQDTGRRSNKIRLFAAIKPKGNGDWYVVTNDFTTTNLHTSGSVEECQDFIKALWALED